jgi:hypothetical protein
VEASRQTPAPLAPPPITTKSKLGLVSTYCRCCYLDLNPLKEASSEGSEVGTTLVYELLVEQVAYPNRARGLILSPFHNIFFMLNIRHKK